MQHLSEVAQILRAALAGDENRVRSYAELLMLKLSEEGEARQAKIIDQILQGVEDAQIVAQ